MLNSEYVDCFLFSGSCKREKVFTGFLHVCSQLYKREKLAAIKIFLYFLSLIAVELFLLEGYMTSFWVFVGEHARILKRKKWLKVLQTFILEWRPEVENSRQFGTRKQVGNFGESFWKHSKVHTSATSVFVYLQTGSHFNVIYRQCFSFLRCIICCRFLKSDLLDTSVHQHKQLVPVRRFGHVCGLGRFQLCSSGVIWRSSWLCESRYEMFYPDLKYLYTN